MILNDCEWLGFGGRPRSKFNRIGNFSTRLPGSIELVGREFWVSRGDASWSGFRWHHPHLPCGWCGLVQGYSSSRRTLLLLVEELQHCGAVFVITRVMGQGNALAPAL